MPSDAEACALRAPRRGRAKHEALRKKQSQPGEALPSYSTPTRQWLTPATLPRGTPSTLSGSPLLLSSCRPTPSAHLRASPPPFPSGPPHPPLKQRSKKLRMPARPSACSAASTAGWSTAEASTLKRAVKSSAPGPSCTCKRLESEGHRDQGPGVPGMRKGGRRGVRAQCGLCA